MTGVGWRWLPRPEPRQLNDLFPERFPLGLALEAMRPLADPFPAQTMNTQTIIRAARVLIALAVAIYVAGEFSGRFVHQLNDALASRWSALLAPTADPEPVAPLPHPPVKTSAQPLTGVSVIVLLHLDGWSQRRIARELGISRHQVSRTLAMA